MKHYFLAEAAAELDEALNHYLEHGGELLAAGFLSQVHEVLALIEKHPSIGKPETHHLRRFGLKRFPFDVVYQVEGPQLVIVALVHHRRKPGYWRHR
jgi:toxin ParE1/3/4